MRLTLIILISLCLSSCSNETEEVDETVIPESPEPAKINPYSCSMNYYSQVGPNNSMEARVKANNGKVHSIIVKNTDKEPFKIQYDYNGDGTLAQYQLIETTARYYYSNNGQLIAIDGEGDINRLEFQYNDEGLISQQKVFIKDAPIQSQDFEYNEEGKPIKLMSYDAVGVFYESIEFTYDDKVNPFKGLGLYGNIIERKFGYPIGNFENNITSVIKTSYDSKGLITSTNKSTMEFSYNEKGYPTAVVITTKKGDLKLKMEYDCD